MEITVLRDADPIDTKVLHALFEPFDLNDDGTGVTTGLYLARALTVAHGGTIGVDQDEQCGALWVRVPRRRSPIAAPPPGLRTGRGHTFKLVCGDVLPGCTASFVSTARDDLLGRVGRHAAAAHGITEITPEVQAAVESRIAIAS